MEITKSAARRISQLAWGMAVVGTIVGQVHALARFQAHPGDLEESPLTRAWAEPAIRALRPLLDWSDEWTVYVTYGKLWTPVCAAFTAAMTLSVFGDYYTPWVDQMSFWVSSPCWSSASWDRNRDADADADAA